MSKEGFLFENFDPKPAIQRNADQRNAENARDWEFSEESSYLYGKANLFKDRFLDPILHTDRGRLPDPVISFDTLKNKNASSLYPTPEPPRATR